MTERDSNFELLDEDCLGAFFGRLRQQREEVAKPADEFQSHEFKRDYEAVLKRARGVA